MVVGLGVYGVNVGLIPLGFFSRDSEHIWDIPERGGNEESADRKRRKMRIERE